MARPRTSRTAVAALTIVAVVAALFPPPAVAAPPLVSPTGAGTVVIGPQAMEGNLQIHPGDPLRAGFDFTMPGSHAAATASFSSGYVSLLVKCPNGSTPPLTIQLQPQTVTDPAGSSSWYPSGDQSSSLVYQGALTAPDLCSGGVMNDASGAQFTTSFFSTDTIDKVNFRFHYSDNTSGSWSATVTGTPTPFAKTVTTATLTPALSMVLSSDHATAVPGDTITYSATVTNSGSTLAVGGDFLASATGASTATVKSYWDDVSTSIDGSTWTVLGGAAAAASGYTPAASPPTTSGMSLAATSVAATGVTYPSSGDPILGTTIASGSTGLWHYTASLNLSASQAAALFDPTKVKRLRNTFHLEVSPANPNVSQTAVINLDFSNLFYGGGPSASLTNVKVTIQPPGTAAPLQFNSTTTPALATLASGSSASVQGPFVVPAAPAKASGQTDAAYFTVLSGLEGSILKATGSASGTAITGTVNAATPAPVTTIEHLPIVSITKSGPAAVTPGSTETNPLALTNSGGATASTLGVTDSVSGGGSGTVTGVPATLAPGASASATATFAVPAGQAPGALTDVASLTWQDANSDPYGPVSSSFTTTVSNPFAGATLTLAPTTAGPNAPGITQVLTATLLDGNKQPIANQPISFVISGANPKSGTAVTDANGNATFSYVGFNEGTDTAKATFTAPGTTIASNQATITWLQSLQPVATTVVTGNFFPNNSGVCHFGVGPGTTPVFSQQFPNIMFNPDPAIFKFPPPFIRPDNNGTVFNISTRPFTDITTDVNGNPNGTIVASGNGVSAGTDMINFFASFTGSFVINQPGDVTFRILHNDGYILGVGGGATRVSGDFDGDTVPTTTAFNGYPTMAAWNTTSTGSSSSGPATIHFPNPGLYPFEIDYTECESGPLFLNLLTEKFNPQTSPLSVYVGYADGLRPAGSIFPFPWAGSPNVTFEGCAPPCQYDGGTIRIDNSGTAPAQIDSVTVDIPFASGVSDCPGLTHFDIWPHNLTIPAGQILVLAPMAPGTTCSGAAPFDTSDTSFYCGPDTGVIPVVNITSGGVTTSFNDSTQVLNTGGRDQADCGGNESISWSRVGGGGTAVNLPLPPAAQLTLTPFNVPDAVQGQSLTETVSALDGAGNPVASLPVTLSVFGPNAQTQTASTGTDGLVTFTYNGNLAGTDTVQATASIQGLQSVSNTGTVVWTPTGGTNNPLGPSITSPTPADGSIITKPTPVDATIAPPSGHTIASWRVFYQAVAGGPLGLIGSGTGTPPSPLNVTFDPTLLVDGAYRLTVEATADDGAIQDVVSGVAVYGALKIGRYTTSFKDLSVPVDGLTMDLKRAYDSTDKSNGDFGVGWRVDIANVRTSANHILGAGGWTQYNTSCTFGLCFTAFKNSAPRYVTVRFPDGHVEVFDFNPDGGTNIFWSCTPKFTARASLGTTSTLVPLDDTSCSYTGDGNLYGKSGAYNPQQFQLTTRGGQVYVLDAKLGLVSVTDRSANKLTVDGSGVHSSNGESLAFVRDGSNRITTVTGPDGATLHYFYNSSGDLASVVDPDNNTTVYTYDANHDLLSGSINGTSIQLNTERYDSAGRLVAIVDASGHQVTINNSVGTQSIATSDALNTLTTVTHMDDLGDAVAIDEISGGQTLTTTFTYDGAGHMLTRTDVQGHTSTLTYDTQGDLTSITDARHNTTRLTYDSLGYVTGVVAPDGTATTAITYDSQERPTSILQDGRTTTYAYDAQGRMTSTTDGTGRTITVTYDSNGHPASVADATGTELITEDAAGRMTSLTDPSGHKVRLAYDLMGNQLSVTDPSGGTQSATYDAAGRVTSRTDADGKVSTLTYDAAGNLVSTQDRNGGNTQFVYDADAHLVKVTYQGGGVTTMTYDAIGRVTGMTDGVTSLSSTYDAASHLLSQSETLPTVGTVTNTYGYDENGNRTSLTSADGTTHYSYDSQNRLVSMTDPSGGIFNFNYDSTNQLVSLTRPNGVTDAFTYDAAGKLLSRTSSHAGVTVAASSQTFDANGLVGSRSDLSGTTTYSHDSTGQLIGVTPPGGPTQSYVYDANGNRVSDPISSAATYDPANRLVSDSNYTYTYDLAGNRTSRTNKFTNAVTQYTYDGHGDLASVQNPDGTTTSFTYDVLGRRVQVTAAGQTTTYAYDGGDVHLEYSGTSQVASYVDPLSLDYPLEMRRGSQSYFYQSDVAGNVSALTDASGAVAASYSYDGFGVPTSSSGSPTNPFTYAGREYDSKSGLYYNRARYYEPSTGRFLSEDPVASVNAYAYVRNDPVDLSDPTGAQNIFTYLRSTIAAATESRLVGCEVGIAAVTFEYLFGLILSGGTNPGAMVASLAIACAVGALWPGSTLAIFGIQLWYLFLLPIAIAVLGVLSDVVQQLVCARTSHQSIQPGRELEVFILTYLLAQVAALAGPAFPGLAGGIGLGALTGGPAGVADQVVGSGTCPQ